MRAFGFLFCSRSLLFAFPRAEKKKKPSQKNFLILYALLVGGASHSNLLHSNPILTLRFAQKRNLLIFN